MIILRNAILDDLDDIFELSQKVIFINLPADKRIIKQKIIQSEKSFTHPDKELSKNYYIFVAVDDVINKVIGVSMIHAQHGTENEPHFFFTVAQEKKFSTTINTGFVHGTLKLGIDTNGPTEIGALVVDPEYRGHQQKIGKQLSFIRFLYMSIFPQRFKEYIHSELMPPLDEKGNSPLWEAIGRRFLNMDYIEADILSRNNKEFILNLFPNDNIYMPLLPLDARNAIGKVGADTLPVKKMLESVGFKYTDEVDPFDGGPHYRCKLTEIKPIKNKYHGEVIICDKLKNPSKYLLSIPHKDYTFFAKYIDAELINDVLNIDTKEIPTKKKLTAIRLD